MKVVEITSSEFRKNQKNLLDMAAKGVSVLIYRGTEMFRVIPVNKEHIFDASTKEQIETSEQQISQGESVTVKNKKELHNVLDSL